MAWQAHSVASWLSLGASPTFALMALNGASHAGLCLVGSSILPIGGMTAMYVLMSLFHLSPWLGLVSDRKRLCG